MERPLCYRLNDRSGHPTQTQVLEGRGTPGDSQRSFTPKKTGAEAPAMQLPNHRNRNAPAQRATPHHAREPTTPRPPKREPTSRRQRREPGHQHQPRTRPRRSTNAPAHTTRADRRASDRPEPKTHKHENLQAPTRQHKTPFSDPFIGGVFFGDRPLSSQAGL